VWAVGGGSAESHAKFTGKHGFSTPLLLDPGLATARAYDATIGVGPLRIIRRSVIGVARDGRIAFVERGSPDARAIVAGFAS